MPGNDNPTTKFKVDISELKAGIQESNRLIRLANSEFKAASSGMDNWADSTDGLSAKIKQLNTVQEQEEKKLENLQEQYRKTVEAQGENSKGAQELAIKINNQRAAVNKVSAELSTYEDRLGLVEEAHRNAERSGNSFEDELRDLERALDNSSDAAEDAANDGYTILKGTLAELAADGIGSVINAVKDYIGYLMELPEATKEFRTVFGAAKQSAEDSAVGVDGAKKAFEEFYKVAADEGQAAEATSHLVDLAKNEAELQKAIDGVTGAWVEHGDSISIEGLSEAAAETYKTGKLTGQMTDAIVWAGKSEEEFQKKLDECSSEQERQQLVVDTLNGLYGENAKAYRETHDSLLTTNEANLKLLQSQSKIADTIEPLTAGWTNLKAKALDFVTPAIGWAADKVMDLTKWLKENETAASVLSAVVITLATGFGVLAAAFAITNIINAVRTAMSLLNVTMLANPFVLVAALIAGLVAAFIYLWNTSDGFRNFFIKLWENIKEASGNAIDAVVGFFKKLPGRVSEWFDKTIGKAVSFKDNLISEGKKAAKGLFDSIVETIAELPGELMALGSDIVEGLWNGISDMTGWITGKLDGFGDSVLDGIKDFFGIESPSKLMRDEVGKFLAEGIGVGFTTEARNTVKAMKDSLSGTVGVVKTGLQTAGVAGGGVVNNYNFNQTNNSPKALSRLEIYRQTRNQFKQLQEA